MVMGTRATLSAVRDNVLSKTYLQSLHDIVDAVFAKDEKNSKRYFINKLEVIILTYLTN